MAAMPILTISHWVYLVGIIVVIFLMVRKREVIAACLVGTFIIGLIARNWNPIGGAQVLFRSMVVAGTELFDIILVIALMVAMLKSIAAMGADKMMVSPAAKLIRSPRMAFWVVAGVMYLASIFFWPSPATALVGTILIPIAVAAGLKPLMAAVALNIAGHGMALSGDMVLQGAPAITAAAAEVPVEGVLFYGALFSTIIGVVALASAFFLYRNDMVIAPGESVEIMKTADAVAEPPFYAKYFAIGVPVLFIAIVVRIVLGSMATTDFTRIFGGAATSLLGGAAVMVLLVANAVHNKGSALEKLLDYLRDGFLFAIKVFTPVIPIAGFFFLGAPNQAAQILGEGAPGLLFDLGNALAHVLPLGTAPIAIGMAIVALISGLDGSGFSGLPLAGALSASLAGPVGLDVSVLAGFSQAITIFAGGGTLAAWAFGAVAAAGVAGVSATEMVRKNFIPVMIGVGVATIVCIILL